MESILFFIIGGLFVVIIVEFFFMQWMIESVTKDKSKLLEELSRSNRALVSKNAHEYVMTASIDKVMTDEVKAKEEESDEIPEETLSDKDWFKAMGIKEEQPAN